MNRRPTALLVAVSLSLTGCAAHVAFPRAPPRDAPYVARVQAYNAYRPLAVQYTTTVSNSRYGGSSVSTVATGLLLANGTRVVYPEDLIPLAGDPSPMTNMARETLRVQSIGTALVWSGFGALLVGTGLVVGGFMSLFTGSVSGNSAALPLMVTGGAFMLTAPIILTLIGGGFGVAAARNRETAYQLFEPSLRQNLGLCGDGTQLGDCPTADSSPGTNALPPVSLAP
jgi:hypothetical protein